MSSAFPHSNPLKVLPNVVDNVPDVDLTVNTYDSPYSNPDSNSGEDDENASLRSQALNADGTPKRPMNAFMIFARRRRPQVSAANQMMRTGEISKILSKEWNTMPMSDKQFYLDQAKKLKETFNTKYPDYVYRRRPNNSRKKRRTDAAPYSPLEHSPAGDEYDDVGLGYGPDPYGYPQQHHHHPSLPSSFYGTVDDGAAWNPLTHPHHKLDTSSSYGSSKIDSYPHAHSGKLEGGYPLHPSKMDPYSTKIDAYAPKLDYPAKIDAYNSTSYHTHAGTVKPESFQPHYPSHSHSSKPFDWPSPTQHQHSHPHPHGHGHQHSHPHVQDGTLRLRRTLHPPPLPLLAHARNWSDSTTTTSSASPPSSAGEGSFPGGRESYAGPGRDSFQGPGGRESFGRDGAYQPSQGGRESFGRDGFAGTTREGRDARDGLAFNGGSGNNFQTLTAPFYPGSGGANGGSANGAGNVMGAPTMGAGQTATGAHASPSTSSSSSSSSWQPGIGGPGSLWSSVRTSGTKEI